MENKLDELSHISTTDCDTDHQLLVAMLKVRLGKRQRQCSILHLNLEELEEDKAVQFAADVTNRFTALAKTVLLEVARETIGSVKSQKKKKWISDETYAAIREKRSKRQRQEPISRTEGRGAEKAQSG